MQTIYKYPLTPASIQKVRMPREAKILCCQIQDGIPTLWEEQNNENT